MDPEKLENNLEVNYDVPNHIWSIIKLKLSYNATKKKKREMNNESSSYNNKDVY